MTQKDSRKGFAREGKLTTVPYQRRRRDKPGIIGLPHNGTVEDSISISKRFCSRKGDWHAAPYQRRFPAKSGIIGLPHLWHSRGFYKRFAATRGIGTPHHANGNSITSSESLVFPTRKRLLQENLPLKDRQKRRAMPTAGPSGRSENHWCSLKRTPRAKASGAEMTPCHALRRLAGQAIRFSAVLCRNVPLRRLAHPLYII